MTKTNWNRLKPTENDKIHHKIKLIVIFFKKIKHFDLFWMFSNHSKKIWTLFNWIHCGSVIFHDYIWIEKVYWMTIRIWFKSKLKSRSYQLPKHQIDTHLQIKLRTKLICFKSWKSLLWKDISEVKYVLKSLRKKWGRKLSIR